MISLNFKGKLESKRLACGFESVKRIKRVDKNILINGDNLEALKALTHEHKSLVDVIYIDPPYNTKNHKFLYDDKFKSHASWLSFIYPRLILACGLLSEDGVIFISIDDNELAHLKLLCDEVFGEQNFISQFVWQKKNKASYLHKKVAKMNEYILCYAKDINMAPMLSVENSDESKHYPLNFKNNPEKELLFSSGHVEFKLQDSLIKAGDMSSKTIKCNLLDDVEIKDGKNVNDFRMSGGWRYTQENLDEMLNNGAKLSVSKLPFRVKLIKNTTKAKMMNNFLTKSNSHMPTYEDANAEIVDIFGFEAFIKAKPIGLIKTLVKSVTYLKKDALVLDFFAGSGTTADAIFKLNSEDNGKRKFILIQNSEKIDKNQESYKKGYKTMYEIMRQRVDLACAKYKTDFVEYKL
ncbi:site-specific DNA-methyltransferase [Sulfurimonas sp.]